jgi:hypothetical protein
MRLLLLSLLASTICICRAQTPISKNPAQFVLPTEGDTNWLYNLYNQDAIPGFKKINKPGWEIGMDNFWAEGQSASYFGDGLFSEIRASGNMSLGGIPIRIIGGIVMQNSKINTRLSTLSVEFDYHSFIEKKTKEMQQNVMGKVFSQLRVENQKLIHEHFTISNYLQTISENKYRSDKDALNHKIDSMTLKMKCKTDSLSMDSLKNKKKQFDIYEHRMDSLYMLYIAKSSGVTPL